MIIRNISCAMLYCGVGTALQRCKNKNLNKSDFWPCQLIILICCVICCTFSYMTSTQPRTLDLFWLILSGEQIMNSLSIVSWIASSWDISSFFSFYLLDCVVGNRFLNDCWVIWISLYIVRAFVQDLYVLQKLLIYAGDNIYYRTDYFSESNL